MRRSGVDEQPGAGSVNGALDAELDGGRFGEADEEGLPVFRWPLPREVNGLMFSDEDCSPWKGKGPSGSVDPSSGTEVAALGVRGRVGGRGWELVVAAVRVRGRGCGETVAALLLWVCLGAGCLPRNCAPFGPVTLVAVGFRVPCRSSNSTSSPAWSVGTWWSWFQLLMAFLTTRTSPLPSARLM